jgi:hypothetical protein
MSEDLTVSEIRSRFNSEWVLVANPRTDKANNVQSGTVLAHRRDRDEVYRHAAALKPARFAMLFTGEIPKDTAIVL